MQPYAPRRIRFSGLHRPESPKGWTLKLYSIVYGPGEIEWARFAGGLQRAERDLPAPAPRDGRPGLGLLIAHQGRTGDYVVLGWWDHENELPLRVWVRAGAPPRWRRARDGESICVWDLEVIWAERRAWLDAMLAPAGPRPQRYLATIDDAHREARQEQRC